MGLISRVSSRTYRYFLQIISKKTPTKPPKMKVKGDLKEYQIIGRKLPSAMDPNPQIYKNEGQRRSQRIPNHRPKTAICHGPQSSDLQNADFRSRYRRCQISILVLCFLLQEGQQDRR